MYTVGQWVKIISNKRNYHFLEIGKVYRIIEIDEKVKSMGIKVRYNFDSCQWVFEDEICPLFDSYLKQIEEYAV